MIITYKREGGIGFFPRLSEPVVIDTEQLDPKARAGLENCFHKADFFALPAVLGRKPAGAADMREYSVTVNDGGRSHTVRIIEPPALPAVAHLLENLDALVSAVRSAPKAR
jgi:hypothetical protein